MEKLARSRTNLSKISNILKPDGTFIQYNKLANKKILIDHWSCISLVDAIPKDWKKIFKSTTSMHEPVTLTHVGNNNVTLGQLSVQIEKATHKDIYNIFREYKQNDHLSYSYIFREKATI